MDELSATIALSRLKGINNLQKKVLADSTESFVSLFKGKTKTYDPDLERKMASFKAWGDIEKELRSLEKMGAHVITIKDREYPELLKHIPDPPLVLFKKGPLKMAKNTIAIVGSRRASYESINLAEKIACTLSSLGITIVSGLARGIDGAAHKGALKEKGKTIGVLGCGIDICYPPENRLLFQHTGDEGAIVTEYGLGESPLPYHFPERNRIIAGLSKGILVVEASKKSGSLITARLGAEYGREVMAIPGTIYKEEYKGANSLIKEGAKLVDGIEDILTTCFPHLKFNEEKSIDMDQDEAYIYSIIGFEKIHVDEVIEKSSMETKRVMGILTRLEMKEAVRQVPGGYYIRT